MHIKAAPRGAAGPASAPRGSALGGPPGPHAGPPWLDSCRRSSPVSWQAGWFRHWAVVPRCRSFISRPRRWQVTRAPRGRDLRVVLGFP